MENDKTVQDDKPDDKSNSQVRSDDSGDDSDISDVSTDSREYVPSLTRNPLRELILNSKRNVLETHGSSEITIHSSIDINKDSEVNSTNNVDSIACSSGAQQNYDDPHHVSMLQEKKDYFDAATGSELNVPKQESTGISSNEGHLIHILKQSVNEILAFTDEYQLSTDDPEFDENRMLQNCVQNKKNPETDSQLPLPPGNDEIESNECNSTDMSYSNANDQKIPVTHSASHIVNFFSNLSVETPGQVNDNLDDKLPNTIKSEDMCNSTSHSSDVIPVAVCNNTSIGPFPSSTFTKNMSFVSADDKPKVSFSFPSSTGPDVSFGINKAFSNLPASKNTFHVKTSSNSDGLFKFKISSLNNGNYSSIDSVSKTMPSTSTSNIQNPVPGSSGSSSLSFSSTLSPSTYGHTATSTDTNNFQHVNSPDNRVNNASQCCQTTSQGMNTFSTISQNPFSSPFNDTSLLSDTGLSLFDKKPGGNNTNLFPGFSCTTSPVSSSPVFHFTNQSNTAKVVSRRPAVRTPKLKSLPKLSLELFAQNNGLLTSSFSSVSKDKPNFCFGSTEQQTSKKPITETTSGYFNVGLFGDNKNEPNFCFGSMEQQTSKKSNAGTTPGSFGNSNKPNLCFGWTEQQTNKKSNEETATGSFGIGLFGSSNDKPNLFSGSTEEQTKKKSNMETASRYFDIRLFGGSNKPNLSSGSTGQQTSKKSIGETVPGSFGIGLFGNNNKPNTTSGSFGVGLYKPNLCFGLTEQQTSKKSNTETATGSFGVGLFGNNNNNPNLSSGSTEQQTSKKSNAETAPGPFGVGFFGNSNNKPNTTSGSFGVGLFVSSNNKPTFGSREQQTSKNSTMWNVGSHFESQGTATTFKFGESCKFPNGAFYGQRPEKKFDPRPERGWTCPACNESGDTSNKPEIPFRVVRGSEVLVKSGVTKTTQVRHQHITAMLEYSSLSFEELRFQHNKYNGKPRTATCTTSNKRTQTTDNSLVVEKYLNKMWKVLECPVCLEITTAPVLQCEQGHHVCSSCWEKVPSCPLCKRRRSKSRNYVAEALVEKFPLPCKYRVDGCMKTMSYIEKRNHEDVCAYRTCYCLADGCNQACNFKAMTVHLKDSHSHLLSGILFCASKREKFSWTLLKPVLQSLVHAFDIPDWGLFLLRQKRALPNTYIWMEIMRFDTSDTGFCYTVEASDSTQVRSITYKGLVLPLNSDTQDCLVIPRHYVNNLRHDVGFCLKISIWRSQS